jgi:MFS transporter, CP family, cyanate transporter
LVGGSWRMSLVFWSIPIAIIAFVVYAFAPHGADAHATTVRVPRKWLPDWRAGLVWRLGILMACVNAIYFSANAFVPIFLTAKGRPDLIAGALTALNVGQLPASILLLTFAAKVERRAWLYIGSGLLSLCCIVGFVFSNGPATMLWAGLLGFSDSSALIVGLALPPLLCKPDDVARTSAGMFTLSYGGAVLIAVICGAAWDLSGVPALAFLPLGVCALGLAAAASRMRMKKELR